MTHDVFISHSKDDKLIAVALCNKLESTGVRCWIGSRDVEPGVDWGAAIIEAIGGCRIMVLIFSLKANNSRHVLREVQRAFEKNLTVIPFRVENVEPTGTLEYYLGPVHWLDAMTPPLEQHLDTVAKRVKALLLPPSVLESATRLAAESPAPKSQTIAKPTAAQFRVPPDASIPSPSQTIITATAPQLRVPADAWEAERDPRGGPPPPPSPASSPTDSLRLSANKIARNIRSLVSDGLRARWQETILGIFLLAVLNVVAAGVFKEVGFGALLACLMGLTLCQMGIFFRVGWGVPASRWLRLLVVAIAGGLIMSIAFLLWNLGGLKEWGFFVTGIYLSLGSGGAVSVVADRRNKGIRSAVLIGAAGVGSFFIVLVALSYFSSIFRQENTKPSQNNRGPGRQGMRLRP